MRFYAGFPTFYARIAPHAMITLIAQDHIKKWWNKLETAEASKRKAAKLQHTISELDRGDEKVLAGLAAQK